MFDFIQNVSKKKKKKKDEAKFNRRKSTVQQIIFLYETRPSIHLLSKK